MSSVISRLNDKRDAAVALGEDAGFTLIEIMVVVLILAILLAIAIPTFLGVTGGANDRAAQSNLNTALTTVKAAATQNNQNYLDIFGGLAAAEPTLEWNNDSTISTQGPVSVHFSLFLGANVPVNGMVITAFSKNGPTCWYVVDNLAAVIDGAPYGAASATTFPNTPGTWYSKGTPTAGECNPSAAPVGASWSHSFSG